MNLTLSAIKRPIWVWMCVVAALVLGWRALNSLPVEENPEVSFPNISVQTSYFGANPEEIENQITRVIEEAVSGVNGIQTIESTSIEGVSIVSVQFELGINQDTALSDIKSKVDGVLGRLPDDVERPIVSKLDFSGMPIIYVAAESDRMTPLEMRNFLDDRVQDRLARIPGVAQVSVQGGQVREIRVAVDRDRLLSYGIGILDVTNAIRTATINVPGGRITEGSRETSIRVQGEFKSVDELRNLQIPISNMNDPNGTPAIVRLSDIADITDGPAERTVISRVNGREAVLVGIQKSREGNTVDITNLAKAELARIGEVEGHKIMDPFTGKEIKSGKETGIRFTITQESAETVKESITDLNVALILGILLVIGIIYLFLHNFRGTLIVALAIPTCLFVAFALIQAFGFTLNSMTMLGLSLAIGILVDDAIVVLENTYRHLVKGEDPQQAALNGRMEIGLAALAITMVDLVVFLPVAFMGGIIGQFFRPFALTVAAATFTSLLVSFTLTPMLASRWYRKGENLEDKHGFAKWFDERFHAFAEGYRQLLDKALERRWLVFMAGWAFLFGVFMMVAAGGGMPDMGKAVEPARNMALMAVTFGLGLAIGSTVARTTVAKVIAVFALLFCFMILPGILGAINPAALMYIPAIAMVPLGIWLGGFFKKKMLTPLWAGLGFAAVLIAFGVVGYKLYENKGAPLLANRFFGGGDQGQVQVQITMPPGSSLERTTAVVERIEKIALELPETEYVTSQVGALSGGFGVGNTGSQYAGLTIDLIPKAAMLDSLMFWKDHGDVRAKSSTTITSELQQLIGKVPDAKIVVTTGGAFGGAPIDVRIMSTNPDLVPEAAQKALEVMSGIEGLVNLELSSKPGKPEMLIRPDRVRLADNDLSVQQLGSVTRTLFEGDTASKYREAGLEYDIRVNLTDEVRQSTESISSVPIKFDQSNPVFLGDLADIVTSVGPDKVERRDRQRQIAVTAQLLPGFITGTMGAIITEKLNAAKAAGQIPEEVTFSQGGENEVQAREFPYLGQAFGLGLILVFLVLASLFDNILYPFIIQLAQPQAFVGALLALMMTNQALDLVGMIGFIMLIGLVGKNAILLVDYTNTLREQGRSRHDALLEAGPIRLRPIMMTTLAMILAMLPIAAAIGRGSEFRAPLGIVIIGGLTLSTLLTLFVIPASYTLFDDLSTEITGVMQRRRDRLDAKKRARTGGATGTEP